MQIPSLQQRVKAGEIDPQRIANDPSLTEEQKIAEASRQFEAILVRQILANTQKPVIQSKLTDNSTASEIYRDMVTTQLASSISSSGAFGLAKIFERQLTHPGANPPKEPATHPKHPAGGVAPSTSGDKHRTLSRKNS